MKGLKLFAASISILVLAFTVVRSGTVIVIDTWSYDQYSESGTTTMYLGDNKVRVEFAGKENSIQAIFNIENTDAPVAWILEPATESYTKMDKKILKDMRGGIQQTVEMMDNYVKNLSAEERDEIKTKYKKQLRQADHMLNYEERMKKTTFEKVAGGEKVNAWTCDHFKGMFNKELRKEVWVAGWSDLGVELGDVAVLNAIAEAFPGLVSEVVPFSGQKIEGSGGTLDGFPVKTVYYEGANKVIRQEVKEIRKEDLDTSLFTLPEGYQEKSPVSN